MTVGGAAGGIVGGSLGGVMLADRRSVGVKRDVRSSLTESAWFRASARELLRAGGTVSSSRVEAVRV